MAFVTIVHFPLPFPEAGLVSPECPEQLLIALEPEAASIYCRKLRLHQVIDLSLQPIMNGLDLDGARPFDSGFRQGSEGWGGGGVGSDCSMGVLFYSAAFLETVVGGLYFMADWVFERGLASSVGRFVCFPPGFFALRPTGTSLALFCWCCCILVCRKPLVKVRRSQRAVSGEQSGQRRITHPTVTHAHTRRERSNTHTPHRIW